MNFIVGILLSLASFFGYHQPLPTATFSAAFTPVQGTQYYLSGAGITSTANTIQLTAFQTPDGRPLLMSMFGSVGYASIEPGTSKLEDVTFSGITQNTNGTAILTGVTRGNDFISPYAASSTLAKAHAGGATFILSNTAGFYGNQFLFANNVATSSAVLVFGSTTPPQYDADPIWANFSTQALADVSYVNSVVAGGAANASETVKGIIQLATGIQAASSTSLGSTAARLVLGANLATDTPNTNTSKSDVLMSDRTGHINQSWLDHTLAWVWSGAVTLSNAVSIAASNSFKLTLNTVAYVFPSSQGAAGARLQDDGSGNLSWAAGTPHYNFVLSGTITATSGSGVLGYASSTLGVIPAGVMTASSTMEVDALGTIHVGINCTLYISDSTGNILAQSSNGAPPSGNTWGVTWEGLVTGNNSTSAENYILNTQAMTSGTVNAIAAGQIGGNTGTANVNLANATTLVAVVSAGSNNGQTCAISGMTVSVTP